MSLEGEQSIVAQHPAAVVGHANQPSAAALNFNTQLGRPGIQRVFDQFFDYRSRTLDNLTGRNLICDRIGEDAYSAHLDQPLIDARNSALLRDLPSLSSSNSIDSTGDS